MTLLEELEEWNDKEEEESPKMDGVGALTAEEATGAVGEVETGPVFEPRRRLADSVGAVEGWDVETGAETTMGLTIVAGIGDDDVEEATATEVDDKGLVFSALEASQVGR